MYENVQDNFRSQNYALKSIIPNSEICASQKFAKNTIITITIIKMAITYRKTSFLKYRFFVTYTSSLEISDKTLRFYFWSWKWYFLVKYKIVVDFRAKSSCYQQNACLWYKKISLQFQIVHHYIWSPLMTKYIPMMLKLQN